MKPNSTALAVSLLSSVFYSMHSRRPLKQHRRRARPQPDRQRHRRRKLPFQTKARRPRPLRPPAKPVVIPWSRKMNEDEKQKVDTKGK